MLWESLVVALIVGDIAVLSDLYGAHGASGLFRELCLSIALGTVLVMMREAWKIRGRRRSEAVDARDLLARVFRLMLAAPILLRILGLLGLSAV